MIDTGAQDHARTRGFVADLYSDHVVADTLTIPSRGAYYAQHLTFSLVCLQSFWSTFIIWYNDFTISFIPIDFLLTNQSFIGAIISGKKSFHLTWCNFLIDPCNIILRTIFYKLGQCAAPVFLLHTIEIFFSQDFKAVVTFLKTLRVWASSP